MAAGYPPQPLYPYAIDSDYTLFVVYNTTESPLAADNEPWSEEITVTPKGKTESEIWADNGFANIEGELLYYDAVDKNSNGKVYKLKKCARNLSGSPTKWNKIGTMVRSFVVAEHHTQLRDAIILTEKFIGENFSTDVSTLDYRIRNLQEVPIIFDDFGCPDINLYFTIISSDPSTGTVAHYKLDIIGSYQEFVLNFGDGTQTSSVQEGDHVYSPNANIDPSVTFKTSRCQVVQTPIEREKSDSPQPVKIETRFDTPNFPDFLFPNISITIPNFPETDVVLPPFQAPCIDLNPLGISNVNLPSVILFVPELNIPSVIEFAPISIGPINLPSSINLSLIMPDALSVTFPDPMPNIPVDFGTVPNVFVNWADPPAIDVGWSEPPALTANWADPPDLLVDWNSVPTVNVDWSGYPPYIPIYWASVPFVPVYWGSVPQVSVYWGNPPTIQVNVTVTCPSGASLALTDHHNQGFTDDMLGIGKDLEVEYDVSGFPSEIKLLSPEMPDVRVVHNMPSEIHIKSPEFPNIKFDIPEFKDIKILPPETPLQIEAIGIPEAIWLKVESPIPERIELAVPVDFPRTISIDASGIPDVIKIEGLPDVIRLEHNLPTSIKLEMPDKPEIELVYKGSPIPVQIELDFKKLIGEGDDVQCVAIVPCARK